MGLRNSIGNFLAKIGIIPNGEAIASEPVAAAEPLTGNFVVDANRSEAVLTQAQTEKTRARVDLVEAGGKASLDRATAQNMISDNLTENEIRLGEARVGQESGLSGIRVNEARELSDIATKATINQGNAVADSMRKVSDVTIDVMHAESRAGMQIMQENATLENTLVTEGAANRARAIDTIASAQAASNQGKLDHLQEVNAEKLRHTGDMHQANAAGVEETLQAKARGIEAVSTAESNSMRQQAQAGADAARTEAQGHLAAEKINQKTQNVVNKTETVRRTAEAKTSAEVDRIASRQEAARRVEQAGSNRTANNILARGEKEVAVIQSQAKRAVAWNERIAQWWNSGTEVSSARTAEKLKNIEASGINSRQIAAAASRTEAALLEAKGQRALARAKNAGEAMTILVVGGLAAIGASMMGAFRPNEPKERQAELPLLTPNDLIAQNVMVNSMANQRHWASAIENERKMSGPSHSL